MKPFRETQAIEGGSMLFFSPSMLSSILSYLEKHLNLRDKVRSGEKGLEESERIRDENQNAFHPTFHRDFATLCRTIKMNSTEPV